MRQVLNIDHLITMAPDDAAALLAYRKADGAGEMDAHVLETWLELAPANRMAWERAQAAWFDFERTDDDILEAMRAHARNAGPERRGWPAPMVAAAAIVLVVSGVLVTTFQRTNLEDRPPAATVSERAASSQTYANSGAAPRSYRLADGSWMVLDVASSATATMNRVRRDVALVRGRAFFDVAHDVNRPFSVTAGGQEIVAVGTQFDVRLETNQTRIVLIEGRVSVRAADQSGGSTELLPGQELIAQDGVPPRVLRAEPGSDTDWHARYIQFDDVSLAEAAAELSSEGPDRVVVRDPEVAALRVSGRFRLGDLPRFGRSLALLHPVRLARRNEDTWEIVRAR